MPETNIIAAREEHKYYPYQGIFYLYRNSFWLAGQDSFTEAPAQNPDMFTQLTNVEPVLQGTLQRRRGYKLFANPSVNVGYNLIYSYRNDNTNQHSVVWTEILNVLTTDEQGNITNGTLFTPTAGVTNSPRMVLSTNFGYFSDGLVSDNKKWNGSVVTNWGIDINNTSSVPTSKTAGSGTNSGSGTAWTNPGNVSSNTNFATATLAGTSGQTPSTQFDLAETFGFTLPATEQLTNINVFFQTQTGPASGNFGADFHIQLLRNGAPFGPVVSGFGLPFNGAIINQSANIAPSGLSPTDINGATFGVQIQALITNSTSTFSCPFGVRNVIITVSGTAPALTVGAPGAGNITLLSGRTYFYAYQNSSTGHVSSISPASVSTGPLTNNNVPLTGIPTSLDPQVDTVLILATADGNDQTTLYLVGTIANGTGSFTDNVPDTVLITQSLYQYTDAFGNLHGIANNNRPPAALFPVKHKGRIYMANGGTLFFSKNLNDVTTANGLITSKYEESWPATFSLDISQFAESIHGLLSDGETLWIGTERSIRRLIGDSPSNFQNPEIQFNECGIFNQDVWKVVFYEGQPVGSMWLTPDLRVMSSDFNTYLDVGWPIQDVLNSINKNANFTSAHASFVSNGPADYYMLYIATGNNSAPDTVCVYNLRTQKWFIWKPTDLVTGSAFLIDANGNPRWLFATLANLTNSFYEWAPGLTADRVGNGPLTFPATIASTWLDFGDRNLRKALNQMLVNSANTFSNIQIDGAILQSDFTTPQAVLPATSLTTGPLQDFYVPLAQAPSNHRWYRWTFTDTSSKTELVDSYSIETSSLFRY